MASSAILLPMSPFDEWKRGRPSKPTTHPLGSRLRRAREERAITVRELAEKVGLRPSAASFISQLEAGTKVPNAKLAARLAEALGDDPAIYLAWSALGKRSDPVATAEAVRTLSERIGYPGPSGAPAAPEGRASASQARVTQAAPAWDRVGGLTAEALPSPAAPPSRIVRAITASPSGGAASEWLLVPELPEGADPADAATGGPRVLATHRVDPRSLPGDGPVAEPFAFRVSPDGARRVRDALRAGDLAIATRRFWPLEPGAPCVVRSAGHTLLARVLWNGRQLLLLPGGDDSDFIVLEARDRTALERLLAGRVVAVVPGRA